MIRVDLITVAVFGMTIGLAQGALKEGPWPSDPEQAKVEKEIKEKKKACKELKHIHLKIECSSRIRSQYRAKGVVRGTEQYVDLHYVDLPTKELVEKRDALQVLKDKARTRNDAKFDRVPGELSEEMLASEIQHLEVEMGRRAHEQYEENQQFFEGLKKQKP